MGLGTLGQDVCFKPKFRWEMTIVGVAGNSLTSGVSILPPQKSARPNLAFKEMQAEHLTETIYYPSKPDYKPIQITLYDIATSGPHPVHQWIQQCYNAQTGKWSLPVDTGFLRTVSLQILSGCGDILESWVFEGAYPQQIDFSDLDMGSNEILTCDITLRYARAYIEPAS